MRNYAQKHDIFIVITLFMQSCAKIDQSCCLNRYTMYRHFFWCAFVNISVAGVSLLAQCT